MWDNAPSGCEGIALYQALRYKGKAAHYFEKIKKDSVITSDYAIFFIIFSFHRYFCKWKSSMLEFKKKERQQFRLQSQ